MNTGGDWPFNRGIDGKPSMVAASPRPRTRLLASRSALRPGAAPERLVPESTTPERIEQHPVRFARLQDRHIAVPERYRLGARPTRLIALEPGPSPVRLVQSVRSVLRGPLPNGWPLMFLLVGMPLWWVLGLSSLIFPLAAIPMAVYLRRLYRRERRIALPPAFPLWALYLAWQFVDLLVFGLSPPGTATGTLLGRLLTLILSLVEYIGITVVLLYVGNLPRDPDRGGVPSQSIARWMGTFFLTVLGGGYLGLVAPHFQFTSLVEYLLPSKIDNNAFVRAMVHPVAGQIQSVISTENGRPSAPFGYTNTWGNALSLLLVWFVATWVLRATGRRRWLYGALAAASLVPVILSLNRGLWIGIAFTVAWLLFRQLLRGRIGPILAALAVVGVAGLVFAQTPLLGVVTARLQHGQSNDIRAFVGQMSIDAIKHSPVVGYGGARHSLGSASSIAVGPTSSCPACGSVATGSTGDFWAILFNQGIGGAVLYFGFFAAAIAVFWRQRTVLAEAALVTIALTYIYMLFYSSLPVAPTLVMIAIGILWREGQPGRPAPDSRPSRSTLEDSSTRER